MWGFCMQFTCVWEEEEAAEQPVRAQIVCLLIAFLLFLSLQPDWTPSLSKEASPSPRGPALNTNQTRPPSENLTNWITRSGFLMQQVTVSAVGGLRGRIVGRCLVPALGSSRSPPPVEREVEEEPSESHSPRSGRKEGMRHRLLKEAIIFRARSVEFHRTCQFNLALLSVICF